MSWLPSQISDLNGIGYWRAIRKQKYYSSLCFPIMLSMSFLILTPTTLSSTCCPSVSAHSPTTALKVSSTTASKGASTSTATFSTFNQSVSYRCSSRLSLTTKITCGTTTCLPSKPSSEGWTWLESHSVISVTLKMFFWVGTWFDFFLFGPLDIYNCSLLQQVQHEGLETKHRGTGNSPERDLVEKQ